MTTTATKYTAADVLAGNAGMFVTSSDVARVLGICRTSVEANADTLPVKPRRFGRSVRWSVNDLRAYCGLAPLDPAAVTP